MTSTSTEHARRNSDSAVSGPWTTWFNLSLRALLELGVVAAFAYWGWESAHSLAGKVLLGIAAPLVGFGFWAIVDFRHAGRWAEPLRLAQELLMSGLAALSIYAAGEPAAAALLIAVSVVYHANVYATGGRLLGGSSRESGSERSSPTERRTA